MKNGQLKPGYNLQLSTEKQFIVNYTLHANPTDTLTLPAHIEDLEQQTGTTPKTLTADAGYGSEQNYEVLATKNIEAFVKYNLFDKEQQGKRSGFAADQLYYNSKEDYLICPMGQHMHNAGTYNTTNRSGYEQTVTRYRAADCSNCPLRGVCHQQKGDRIIEVNHRLRTLKQQAADRLRSPEGIARRKNRCADIEPVFANIKHNKGFRRFMLRGLEKVLIETGLIALAHNLQKFTKAHHNAKTTTQAA